MSLQAGFALTVRFGTNFRNMVLLTTVTKLAVACSEMLAHRSIIWSQGDISCVSGPFGQMQHQDFVSSFYLNYAAKKFD